MRKARHYHYTDCGLDYIYLANGYRKVNDPDLGECVAIRDVDGLHTFIAEWIAKHAPCIRGQEIRFFRSFLKLNQTQMGALFRNDLRTVQRWEEEKREDAIPAVADNFIRLFILAYLNNHEATHTVCAFLKEIREELRPASKKPCSHNVKFDELELADTSQGWQAAA